MKGGNMSDLKEELANIPRYEIGRDESGEPNMVDSKGGIYIEYQDVFALISRLGLDEKRLELLEIEYGHLRANDPRNFAEYTNAHASELITVKPETKKEGK